MNREGKVLRRRLADFKEEMIRAFIGAEYKHKEESVTDDEFDWRNFDWVAIEEHFWKEIDELKENPGSPKELVDIANMAFLLWWHND